MTDNAPTLPDTVPALQAMVMNRDAELRTCRLMIEKLEHQLADHRQHRFGARSETSDQLSLWIENREIGEAMAAPAPLSGDKGWSCPGFVDSHALLD